MQEQYAQNMGIHTPGMQMSDVYSTWSATTTVQLLSVHARDKQEIKKYLSMGQKARFWYAPRPKKGKEDSYVDSDLGVLIKLHKQFVAMHKWKLKQMPCATRLAQHMEHRDYLIAEIERIIEKLPTHAQWE